MSERSEPKQVCRRNALAFLGYAAVFGLVASSAILAASQAEAQTTTRARHAHDAARRCAEVRDGAPSGTANRANRTTAGTPHGTHRAA